MTSIKPTGMDPTQVPTGPHAGVQGTGEPAGQLAAQPVAAGGLGATRDVGDVGSASFAQELQRAQQLTGQVQVGASGDPVAVLVRDLEGGRLTVDQALDALVERAVGGLGHRLSEQERADLLGVLRTALGSDPTLAALRDAVR